MAVESQPVWNVISTPVPLHNSIFPLLEVTWILKGRHFKNMELEPPIGMITNREWNGKLLTVYNECAVVISCSSFFNNYELEMIKNAFSESTHNHCIGSLFSLRKIIQLFDFLQFCKAAWLSEQPKQDHSRPCEWTLHLSNSVTQRLFQLQECRIALVLEESLTVLQLTLYSFRLLQFMLGL